jgi:hypothetical protein
VSETILHFAVVHIGQNRMEVVAERAGVRRKVEIAWQTKVQTDVPPPHWDAQVRGELDFQDAEDLAKKQGRILPGY